MNSPNLLYKLTFYILLWYKEDEIRYCIATIYIISLYVEFEQYFCLERILYGHARTNASTTKYWSRQNKEILEHYIELTYTNICTYVYAS